MSFEKRFKRLFLIALILSLLLRASSWAGSDKFSPFVESFPNGKIDWDNGIFYGVGIGYPHLNKGSKAKALKVAQAKALSAILQVASRLRVDDRSTLGDLEKEKVIIQIRGLILYEPHDRQFNEKGEHPFYRVTYRAPIKGVKGLTKKLLTHLRSRPSSWQDFPREEAVEEQDESQPWLVLDARGLARQSPVQAALFPRIVTEAGEKVYDLNSVEEGALVKRGMARYVISDKSLTEMGFMQRQRPFFSFMDLFSPRIAHGEEKLRRKKRGKYIIQNVREAKGLMKTNLVISESDARDIRNEDASSRILKKCRVIVIVSSSLGGIEGKGDGIRKAELSSKRMQALND